MKIKTCIKDNSGITLVELIVVMAIISVISVSTIIGVGILGYGNAKSAAGRIRALSDNVRIENMTKKETYYLVIHQVNKDYCLTIQTEKDGLREDKMTKKLDLGNGRISFQDTEGIYYIVSSEPIEDENVCDSLELTFKRETGGLKEYDTDKWVKTITVESGNKSYNIHLVAATGKAYID